MDIKTKKICAIGMVGSLVAAEGLNRLSNVPVISNGEVDFIHGRLLYIALIALGIFIASFFTPLPRFARRLIMPALIGTTIIMPIIAFTTGIITNWQISVGFCVAAVASFWIPVKVRKTENT